MSEEIFIVPSSESVLALFGACDRHVRRISGQFGVRIWSFKKEIHIAGSESEVQKAQWVVRHLLGRDFVSDDDVSRLLNEASYVKALESEDFYPDQRETVDQSSNPLSESSTQTSAILSSTVSSMSSSNETFEPSSPCLAPNITERVALDSPSLTFDSEEVAVVTRTKHGALNSLLANDLPEPDLDVTPKSSTPTELSPSGRQSYVGRSHTPDFPDLRPDSNRQEMPANGCAAGPNGRSSCSSCDSELSGSPIEVRPLDVFTGRKIRPRTAGQAKFLRALQDNELTFCSGPAGTGKTYLAVAAAVSAMKAGSVERIMLVRPAVEAGESLGFLPGDLRAKINPYLRPLFDALRDMMDPMSIKRLTEEDIIEVIPLAYMRGRTFNSAYIILDEAQNTTVSQMKMFLTRMGENSRVVVSGDVTQIDLPPRTESGLVDALKRLKGIRGISMVQMTASDIVRHKLVQRIVNAYEGIE